MWPDFIVFVISALIILGGAVGVIAAKNPVHSALFLIQTLFGVAVLFVLQEAHFLAAIQVIVYAGAIVILFLFVIMLLGVDRADDLGIEPISGQRPVAVIAGGATLALLLTLVAMSDGALTGQSGQIAPLTPPVPVEEPLLDDFGQPAVDADGQPVTRERLVGTSNVEQLGNELFTTWVLPFELTGLLLTIAVVGAVLLVRRVKGDIEPVPVPVSLVAGTPDDDGADVADGADDDASGDQPAEEADA